MPSPSHPSRQQVAAKRLAAALGFAPETAADEWLEACADAAESSPAVASALADAYRQRDTIGWSKPASAQSPMSVLAGDIAELDGMAAAFAADPHHTAVGTMLPVLARVKAALGLQLSKPKRAPYPPHSENRTLP